MASSEESGAFEHITEAVLRGILERLPYRELARARVVCKAWAAVGRQIGGKPRWATAAHRGDPPPVLPEDAANNDFSSWTARQLRTYVSRISRRMGDDMREVDVATNKEELVELAREAASRCTGEFDRLADDLLDQASIPSPPDLCLVFGTVHWGANGSLNKIARKLADRLPPSCVLYGAVASGIVATEVSKDKAASSDGEQSMCMMPMEVEDGDGAALSVSLLRLAPGASATVHWHRSAHMRGPADPVPGQPDELSRSPQSFEQAAVPKVNPSVPGREASAALITGDDASTCLTLAQKLQERYPELVVSGALVGDPLVGASVMLMRGGRGPHAPESALPGGCLGGAAALVLTGLGTVCPCVTRGAKQIGPVMRVVELEEEDALGPHASSRFVTINTVSKDADGVCAPMSMTSAIVSVQQDLDDMPHVLWLGIRKSRVTDVSDSSALDDASGHAHGSFRLLNIETTNEDTGGLCTSYFPVEAGSTYECALFTATSESSLPELYVSAKHAGTELLESQKAALDAERKVSISEAAPSSETVGAFAAGAIAIICAARGAAFHGRSSVDVETLRRGLNEGVSGAGCEIPIVGILANGEIGSCPWSENRGGSENAVELMGYTGVISVIGL